MSGKSAKPSRQKARSKSNVLDESGPADGEPDASSDEAARLVLRESDKLYYRIGEVSRITGVKAHVLRYWETEFRWMAPPKSRSKQRLYRKRDIEFVWLLKRLLWDERYTIAGARQRIQELGVEEALALLDQPGAGSTTFSTGVSAAHPSPNTAGDSSDGVPSPSSAAWVSFRSALDEMQSELVTLRGVLQDGA
jgi:DNA-binding transcriptional MerR regulator